MNARLRTIGFRFLCGILSFRTSGALLILFATAYQAPGHTDTFDEPRNSCVASWDCERGVRIRPAPDNLQTARMNELNTYRHAHLENAR